MQKQLIQWYQQNKRDFPWRKDQNTYHIWISEIMLQQTTTETVIPYYERFLENFPTIEALASASLEEVYKMWEGLGYYRRAKHLHESAQIIVEKYQGKFPYEYNDILSLKGIGEYTAGAISSIAYGKQVPAVDGNVLRIISRYYLLKENIAETRTVENVTSELTSYSYEVEKDVFSFSTSEDKTYYVPYVKISGCSNEKLQWNINHTLWEDACWILDCAEIGGPLYDLFSGENAMQITGIYQYKHYLSVLYEGGTESRLPGKIAYAIVIDMLNGRRVLLGDLIENEDKFEDMLVHYFDDDSREIRLFIFKEDAEKILYYGHMTEKEIVINNLTSDGNNPEQDNGEIDSISYLFQASSFYMSEEGFVVLPGAKYYEPLVFEWEEISKVIVEF